MVPPTTVAIMSTLLVIIPNPATIMNAIVPTMNAGNTMSAFSCACLIAPDSGMLLLELLLDALLLLTALLTPLDVTLLLLELLLTLLLVLATLLLLELLLSSESVATTIPAISPIKTNAINTPYFFFIVFLHLVFFMPLFY